MRFVPESTCIAHAKRYQGQSDLFGNTVEKWEISEEDKVDLDWHLFELA